MPACLPACRSCAASAHDPRGFTCKLADFGFAKLLTPGQGPGGRAGTVADDISGTLHYMAPELFKQGEAEGGRAFNRPAMLCAQKSRLM